MGSFPTCKSRNNKKTKKKENPKNVPLGNWRNLWNFPLRQVALALRRRRREDLHVNLSSWVMRTEELSSVYPAGGVLRLKDVSHV